MCSNKENESAEMEGRVTEEMRLVEEEKNCKEDDLYTQLAKSCATNFEKLIDLYDQLMVMRLESVKVKLDYLKNRQDLESMDGTLENCRNEPEHIPE